MVEVFKEMKKYNIHNKGISSVNKLNFLEVNIIFPILNTLNIKRVKILFIISVKFMLSINKKMVHY